MSVDESAEDVELDDDASIDINYDEWDAVLGRLDSVEAYQDHVVSSLRENLEDAVETIETQQVQIDDLQNQIDSMQRSVGEIDTRTNLLEVIDHSDSMGAKQRSTVLIQHLKRAAEREGEKGNKQRAAINRDDAEKVLHHPDVHRTTIYSDMERAESLVGNVDVLDYQRKAENGRRLVMDLDAGSLPRNISEKTVGGFTEDE